MPDQDKTSYTPEEVNELMKQTLGEEAATQFRLYWNKIQKVPPHKTTVEQLSSYGDEKFQYRFSFEDYANQLGVPEYVIAFTMVSHSIHGGGGEHNMGWINLIFKTVESPDGNKLSVAILDEVQSDFSQRVSRLRQLLNGKLKEDKLLGFEKESWNQIKNDPNLVEPQSNEDYNANQQIVQSGDGREFSLRYLPKFKTVHMYDDRRNVFYWPTVPSIVSGGNVPPEDVQQAADKIYQVMVNKKDGYVPTQQLKSFINKVESTSYSDILKYLFNKALGFAKAKGCQQLWVPSSQMKMDQWKGNAKHGLEALQAFFKRVYDDNSVTYEGVRDLEKKMTGEDFWVIDLGNISDMRLAKIRLSAYWQDPKTKMDSKNWKFYFDAFYKSFKQNYNPFGEEEERGGGVAYEEGHGDEEIMHELVNSFIDEMVPQGAHGDEQFINDLKSYLTQKFKFELPPETESQLYYGAEGKGWRPVTSPIPSKEIDLDAPSFSDLGKMFDMENTVDKGEGKNIKKDKVLSPKDLEDMYNMPSHKISNMIIKNLLKSEEK